MYSILKQLKSFLFKVRHGFRGFPVSIGVQSFRVDESLRRWRFDSELQLQQLIQDRLRSGDTFVDIGANFGLHALLGAQLVGSTGRVIAFEPVPRNINLLQRHVRLNHFDGVIEIVDGAVSDSNAESIALSIPVGEVAVTAALSTAGSMGTLTVRNYRLDDFDFGTAEKIRLIKIDVEGAEIFVLKGAQKFLRDHNPFVAVEIHPKDLAHFGSSPEQIFSLMSDLGYTAKQLSGEHADGTFHVEFSKFCQQPTKIEN